MGRVLTFLLALFLAMRLVWPVGIVVSRIDDGRWLLLDIVVSRIGDGRWLLLEVAEVTKPGWFLVGEVGLGNRTLTYVFCCMHE